MKNLNRNGQRHQKGMGVITTLGIVFLLLYFTVIVITLVPSYVENWSVRSSLTSLIEDESIFLQSEQDIKTKLMRKLAFSNVTHVAENNISVEKGRSTIKVHIDYKVKTKFIKNVDFVINFDEHREATL